MLQKKRQVTPFLIGLLLVSSIVFTPVNNNVFPVHHDVARENKFYKPLDISGDAPPASGTWVIDELTIVQDEHIIVNGSIIIENGGTLYLDNSILYMNVTSNGEHWIEVRNGGALILTGSTITSYNTSYKYYIYLVNGSKFRATDSFIEYIGFSSGNTSTYGIYVETNDISFDNLTITHAYYGFYVKGTANLSIRNVNIANISVRGIFALDTVNMTIENLVFKLKSSGDAIWIENGTNIIIMGNQIIYMDWNCKAGISVYSSMNVSIQNNYINGYQDSICDPHEGIKVKDSINVAIRDNNVTEFTYGIHILNLTYGVIDNNTIYGNLYGILVKDSLINITNNVLVDDVIFIRSKKYNPEIFKKVHVSNNTINGKPVLVISNQESLEVINTSEYGEIILLASKNIYIKNVTTYAVDIAYSKNITIEDSIIDGFEEALSASYSNYTMMKNTNIYSDYRASTFRGTNYTLWDNITIHQAAYGPRFYASHDNTISNSRFISNYYAPYLGDYIENLTIMNNYFYYSSIWTYGYSISHIKNVTIVGNTFIRAYISLPKVEGISILNNTFDMGYWNNNPIDLSFSSNILVINNTFLNIERSVRFNTCHNVTVKYNVFHARDENAVGLEVYSSDNVEVLLNKFYDFNNSIIVDSSTNVTLSKKYYGNYYNTIPDEDKNMLGDEPYIAGTTYVDEYPIGIDTFYVTDDEIVYAYYLEEIGDNTYYIKFRVYNNGNTTAKLVKIAGEKYESEPLTYDEIAGIYFKTFEITENTTIYIAFKVNNTAYYTPKIRLTFKRADSPPVIESVSWVPSEPNVGEDVIVYASVSDDNAVDSVVLSYFDGSWHNVTMSYDGDGGVYVGVIPGLSSSGSVVFKILAVDNGGNWASSDLYTVEFSGQADSPPVIESVSWVPREPSVGEDVMFIISVRDDYGINYVNLVIYRDQVRTVIRANYNSDLGAYVATVHFTEAGTYLIEAEAVDSSGNVGRSIVYTLNVREVNDEAPIINQILFSTLTPLENQSVKVWVDASDDVSVASVKLYYYDGESWRWINLKYNSELSLYEGTIPGYPANTTLFVYIAVTDSAGQTTKSNVFLIVFVSEETSTGEGSLPVTTGNTNSSAILAVGGALIAALAVVGAVLYIRRRGI